MNGKSSNVFLKWWMILLFLTSPFIKYSDTPQGYEIAKFIFWEVWWLGFVVWLIFSKRFVSLFDVKTKTVKIGWLFIIILGLTAFQGGETSFLGSLFRKQGWIFFFQLWIFYLGLRGIKLSMFQGSIAAMGIGAILLVLMAIYERLSGWDRVSASFGEPNVLGGYLALVLPLLVSRYSWLFGIWLGLGVWLTKSTSAIVAILTSAVIYLESNSWLIKKRLLKNLAILAAIIITIILVLHRNEIRFSPVDNRLEVWKFAIRAILSRPFTGYGVDNIEGVLTKFVTNREIALSGLVVDRAHSLILDLWLWSGILGVLSFICWIVSIVWRYIKRNKLKDWSLLAAIGGFIVFTAFNPASIVMWILLYWVLAMMDREEQK